jgi:hypothetical protein
VLESFPIPLPKSQRPPPFEPPPTGIGCGDEEAGDPERANLLLQRYVDMLVRVSAVSEWSIEVLGLRHELGVRFRMFAEVSRTIFKTGIRNLLYAFDDASVRLRTLEEEYFANPEKQVARIPLGLETGWLGPHNPQSPEILNRVRSSFLDICVSIRNRHWHEDSIHEAFVEDIAAKVDLLLADLFSIKGPDEETWADQIARLADAGRVLKHRAYRHSATAMP